ncbi:MULTISPECIES: MFS transporter [Planococcus]|uniref:MFS transporter n=1 Tax=Planococcus faecalis TaxID=1598147 RepID=A0ABM6IPZ7_9BACL|nr:MULTISPECIES: MFS transporter [Planococcus]AQU78578.1 MFS transporter [Planococcus faecalis]MDJ0331454.1 MFS transporter [Planococcus sp. S3-L1]OHX53234.1 MFS transporter [Planococcus faecalis]
MKQYENHQAMLQDYINSPEKVRGLYRRTLWVVVMAQVFGGAGLAAGVTVGALLAQDMLGTDRFAGLPVALFTLGSAAAALIIGRLSQRFSRRTGLATGFLAGAIGAIGVVMAALSDNVFLLFASLLIYGAGTATNLQSRYAGTDLATVKQRGTAISIALVSTTFGAFAGPNLIGVMGRFAESINVPALAGPFILAAVAFSLAGIVLVIFLRPDPLLVSKAITEHQLNFKASIVDTESVGSAINKKGVVLGATVMVLTQLIMFAIMTMTPIHMGHYGHNLGDIGLVISIHIAAMYLPSLVTGVLVDKLGRIIMTVASGVTFMAAGIVAALAPSDSLWVLIVALALLGLGWNFGLISGTTLIVDSTHPSTRAKTQGTVDVLVALAGATGGGLSGLVMAQSSYAVMSLGGGFLALAMIPVVFWSMKTVKVDN